MVPRARFFGLVVIQSSCWLCEAGVTCDASWCSDFLTDCWAGAETQPCSCERGTARVLDRPPPLAGYSQRLHRYTCCVEHGSDNVSLLGAGVPHPARFTFHRDFCGNYDSAYMRGSCVFAVLLCAVGAVFVAGGRRQFLASKRSIEIEGEDDNFENSITLSDGSQLHHSIPPQNWCVKREDLQQFRRLVRRAVLDGRIQPTQRDPFDPAENEIGPSVHTVCEQYVVPTTSRAGNMSWALMLHPEGLQCDLFISHSWEEGVYELLDKIIYSWPAGKQHAYVCFLSNPQNLGIADLLSRPSDSPFAHALRSAKDIMVVSNRKGSVYSRIWCTYEAYVAYNFDKKIFCASRPVPGLWPREIFQSGVCIVGVSIGATFWLIIVFLGLDHLGYYFQCLLIALAIGTTVAYTVQRKRPASLACRRCCAVAAFFANACLAFTWQMDITFPMNWVGILITIIYGMCLEADRLWAVEAAQEKVNLSSGYTGHVRDARCSVPEDGEQIRSELHGQESAVDHCVEVLIHTGLSTRHLRDAAERAGRLGNVSNWYTASVVAQAGGIWVWLPAHSVWWGDSCTFDHGATAYLCVLEGVTWFVLFGCSVGVDRRAFAAKSLLTMMICLAAHMYSACAMMITCSLFAGPFVLTLSFAGPANVARVPLAGRMMVRFFLGDWDACSPCARGAQTCSVELQRRVCSERADDDPADVYGRREDEAMCI
ncbi:unnamed protein product [Prorocentrum cordatum]|uniref:Uncharacterized protein n=1 Tax=Prorocentrum cordatum TaxID=2364126 RepID=A0ABN9RW48_9DINO|nr:unnamed protein product [Polarella glacialis]